MAAGRAHPTIGFLISIFHTGFNSNQQQKVIGHELAHTLNIKHYEPEEYHEDAENYMSYAGFGYQDNLHFDDWQWGSMILIDKWGVD